MVAVGIGSLLLLHRVLGVRGRRVVEAAGATRRRVVVAVLVQMVVVGILVHRGHRGHRGHRLHRVRRRRRVMPAIQFEVLDLLSDLFVEHWLGAA